MSSQWKILHSQLNLIFPLAHFKSRQIKGANEVPCFQGRSHISLINSQE